ncbi:recombination regulator RecX [Clostridium sp. cel8]|jgi:regulatory protein|uniref:recombination regulator RecX n=1 Tax=Clostridium sp. cel8 TaxID=2663123 RepID=UPI0015F39AEC|nr:recombination regulator RecX [Clostridium sp. cel8]MBA5850324.1 recombination regulator RecX [Clostridium sp. cel8]
MCKKIVTEIKLQSRNKKRVNVYVNDEFSFSCSTEIVYKYNIYKGKNIDEDLLKNIIEEDDYIKCKNLALRIIERNFKTEKQIYDRLVKEEYNIKTIERTLNFLKQYKFIDDYKFAKMWIKEKINHFGKNKIRYELVKKGISEDIIETEMESIDESVYKNGILKLCIKKYKTMHKDRESMSSAYRKLGNYLLGRGYNIELIRETLKKVINKEDFVKKEIYSKKDENNIYSIAKKRYNIIARSENDVNKLKRKLSQYLMRRGYLWEDIKPILKTILNENRKI